MAVVTYLISGIILVLLYRAIDRTFFKFNLNSTLYLLAIPISYLASYGLVILAIKLFHLTFTHVNELVKLFGVSIFAIPSSVWLIFIYHYAGKISWFNSIKLSLSSSFIIVSAGIILGIITPDRDSWLFLVLFALYLILTVHEKIKTYQLIPIVWAIIDWFFRWGIITISAIIKIRSPLLFLIFLKLRSVLYNKLSISITEAGLIYKNYNINWADITSVTYNYGLTTICTTNSQITVPGLPESKITKIVENTGLNHYKFLHNKTILAKSPDVLLKIEKATITVRCMALLQCIVFVLMCLLLCIDTLIGDIGNLYMRLILFAVLCRALKDELYELERASFRDALARLASADLTINHEGIYWIVNT